MTEELQNGKSKELTLTEKIGNLPSLPKQYKGMLKHIEQTMPAIRKSSSNFYKSHSQFMGTMLDVTAISPIRSVKHTLAEIDKTRAALEEAHINLRKKDIEMRQKEDQLNNEPDALKRELLETEIIHLQIQQKNTNNSMQGALRKLSYFTTQYKSILNKLGKETITEEEYEDEEETYHIMTCMKQALNAARARGGVIDEGNLIYLFDMGINSAVAQQEIYSYLQKENDMLSKGGTPTHEMTMQWLEHCVERFKGDSVKFAERRGFTLKDTKSLAQLEDKTNGK
jgi:predicted RNase H-like nuclease (RuvC/YqgF family)